MKKLQKLLSAVICSLGLMGCASESASIGIIGGADGPTAVFVTGDFHRVYILIAAVAAAVIAFFLLKRKK